MENKIILKIMTPEKVSYEGEVDELYAETQNGIIGILPEHVPLISVLKPGEIRIKKSGSETPMAVSGGILEVKPAKKREYHFETEVVVLADHLELVHEIDPLRAKEAYARARKIMEEREHMEDVDFVRIQAKIEKELNRIKIGTKYRDRIK